jgi:hypothetical protein
MSRRRRLYTNEELLFRPIEHILEEFTCRELAAIWGFSPSSADARKFGRYEVTREEDERLRKWLQA